MNPISVFLTIACAAVGVALGTMGHLYWGIPFVIGAIGIAAALKMANTWEKFVILRAGNLRGVKGPGLFLIVPVVDSVVAVIDERIQTTAFSAAEEALTKDTVLPVNVDAIISATADWALVKPIMITRRGTEPLVVMSMDCDRALSQCAGAHV